MKKIIQFFVFLIVTFSSYSQELQKFYSEAMIAYKNKNYPEFYTKIKEANKVHPYHQGVLYQAGIAATLNNKKAEAIQFLKQAILIDASFRLEGIADFNSIKDSKEFKDLIALQKEWQQPVINSSVAFTLKDRALHTEGIDYDAAHKIFYLGSIHKRKIIAVKEDGTVADFCSSAFEGMTSIFSLKIDAKRNILWACSSPMQEMENYDSTARQAVFKFDLSSGKLLQKYQPTIGAKKGVYGDLILDRKGKVYITDSQNNDLLTINEKTGRIETIFSSSEFWNIQGLTFSPDEKFLFIADYVKGVFRLDMQTKVLTEVVSKIEASVKGIDGLYFYNNSLIAVQNGVVPLRCVQYFLNKDFSEITRFEIIDRNHPNFNEPTLGVIDGKNFYYIANSQWGGYDVRHKIKPAAQLQDIVALKATLK
jgi:tetratricopeptide (TPR) repeat protein